MSSNEKNVANVDVSADASGVFVESADVNSSETTPQKPVSTAQQDSDETMDVSETPEVEGTEENEEQGEEQSQKPKKNRVKDRIDKLNARISEKERELEHWRTEALKAASKDKGANVEAKPSDEKPNPDKFESYDEYVEALTDWKADQREKAREAKEREKSLISEQESKTQAVRQASIEFAKEHEDFNERIQDLNDIEMSLAVQDALLNSENAPALMYELAKDPDHFEKICQMPAGRAYREIGKVEARLESSSKETKEEQPKKITKAPQPLKGLNSKTAQASKSLDDMDYEEYRKSRNAVGSTRR